MTEPFETRVALSLASLTADDPRARLCVALSGGLDSTALLTALSMRAAIRRRLRAVHVDHGLSVQAAGWVEHCRTVARALRVPLTVVQVAVRREKGASLEAAAREARYRALEAELADGEVLLTAQHLDDQLETVLLQLLRGAGLPGLAAMPAAAPFGRGRLVRPLLGIERRQIEDWARRRKLAWVEDDSNADERLDRNYLRRRVVPELRARWPAASRAAARTARHAAEAQRLLDLIGCADAERAAVGRSLSVQRLRALPPDRRRNALRYWIGRHAPLPDSRRLEQLAGPVLEARADAHPQVVWGTTLVRRDASLLSLGRSASEVSLEPIEWPVRSVSVVELPHGLGRLELTRDRYGPIDVEALPRTVSVRLRRGGERLRLRRGGPSRALKALLQEARVARVERARIPLLCSGGQVLAAGDLWVDAQIRAGAGTRRRGRLTWHRSA
jgi:tRNA(Ile)-lysidine synthase